jgi:hypothetical protein
MRSLRRPAVILTLALLGILAASCGVKHTTRCSWGTSGRCAPYPHHWTSHEVARDVASITFPAATDGRDHLYGVRCRFTSAGHEAVCVGRGRVGSHAGMRVSVIMWLRPNGTLDPICWPDPPALCDAPMVHDQRANPITST